ncbi:hypothetical protein Clacol_007377 [Clathrus columnatus]|uniref:Glutaredoxin domain-containing protein n=1 Tax=Clathrus columnatus TaxID=1419009 RepID=A0AAV5AET3_9AGAM|nr:hypothetical protein Clacol_007377 [Clathrus columnatus]
MSTKFGSKPPKVSWLKLDFPSEHILLITLNRPKSLNAVSSELSNDLEVVLSWFDAEPGLWVVIVTGEGRVFCAGADLKIWDSNQTAGKKNETDSIAKFPNGFANISRRTISSKPMIAAVNGGAYGGGVELILNCDLVIASELSQFALPEVKRGVIAAQGGIPRLAAISGHQLASEMLLLGRTISAQEAYSRFGFVNKVVPSNELLSTAIEWAQEIINNSPDAIMATKRSLLLAQQFGNVEEATLCAVQSLESRRAYDGDNIRDLIKNNKVVIFSKSWCPFCKKAKATLKELTPEENLKILELDVESNGDAIQAYLLEKSGQGTVPNIYIAQQHIGGNDDLQAKHKKGQIVSLITA